MSSIDERLAKLEETVEALSRSVSKLRNGEIEILRISKALVVFDEKSEPRILLSVDDCGDPYLRFLNSAGKTAIGIGCNEGSSELVLRESDGELRLKLSVTDEKSPMRMLLGGKGDPQLSLSVIDDAPRIMLHDPDGTLRVGISTDPMPNIQICGSDELPRILLSLEGEDAEIATADAHGRKVGGLVGVDE